MVHMLLSATCGWDRNRYRLLGGKELDKFRLNHRIEREGRGTFSLAKCTVTAVYNERGVLEAIANRAAGTATLGGTPVW